MYPLKVVGDCEPEMTGTRVDFLPDKEIFEETVFDYDILKQRLREMAFLTKGLKIILTDAREDSQKEKFFTMKAVSGSRNISEQKQRTSVSGRYLL